MATYSLHVPDLTLETTIEVNRESLAGLGPMVSATRPTQTGGSALVITDRHVGSLYASTVLRSLRDVGIDAVEYVLEPGEGSKSLACADGLFRYLSDRRFPRDGVIVAVGGGVVSDLAGFVAATWMRGVRWVICPTSLEAMIDASIGGKTAINIPGGKNLVGAFHPPELVLIDPTCLRTLPEREFRAGLAESVKHALLAGEEFFAWHESNVEAIVGREQATITELIERNVGFKVSVVEKDPFEQTGTRIILNLGHTLGHALEEVCGYSLRHGECVALGLIAACELSASQCGLDRTVVDRAKTLLARFGLPTRLGVEVTSQALIKTIARDKKVLSGEVRWVLLSSIGQSIIQERMDETLLRRVIDDLRR